MMYSRRDLNFVLVASLVLLSLTACGKRRIKVTPQELIGVWRTSAPGYGDRFTEFTAEHLIVGTGAGGSTSYPLNGFHIKPKPTEEGALDIVVFYEAEGGGENSWPIAFFPANGGEIREGHRTLIWRRGKRP